MSRFFHASTLLEYVFFSNDYLLLLHIFVHKYTYSFTYIGKNTLVITVVFKSVSEIHILFKVVHYSYTVSFNIEEDHVGEGDYHRVPWLGGGGHCTIRIQ